MTPSKLYLEYGYLQHKPFYRQTWFMVALAATSIVIIIMVIAVLCVKSKSYKYKRKLTLFNLKNKFINGIYLQKRHRKHLKNQWQCQLTNDKNLH